VSGQVTSCEILEGVYETGRSRLTTVDFAGRDAGAERAGGLACQIREGTDGVHTFS
jgi:hypothetical protein